MKFRSLAFFSVFLVLAGARAASAQLPTPPNPWTPPIGIPNPNFGINEVVPPATLYVNCTTGNDANAGTVGAPKRTIPDAMLAGMSIQIEGTCTGGGSGDRKTSSGTALSPVFIKGVNGGKCTGGELHFSGAYLIVDSFVFDNCRLVLRSDFTDHFALRRSTVRNYSPGGNSSAISPSGSQLVFFANEIHNNGDPENEAEVDIHGMKPDTGDSYIWYIDNHVHHNGGDAIQIGDASSGEPWTNHIFVGRNHMHDDRENAVDIKRARDVIISQNHMHDYKDRSTSNGEAAVTHNGSERIWYVYNTVHDTAMGFVCSGANGYYVIGNVVYNVVHDPAGSFNPQDYFDNPSMLTYSTQNSFHIGNTIWNVDMGISYSGSSKTEIVNNLVGGLLQSSHQIGVETSASFTNGTVVRNNLFVGPVRYRPAVANAGTNLSQCTGCVGASAGRFVNPNAATRDLRIRSDFAEAIGTGFADHAAYTTFETEYQGEFPGLTIRQDHLGLSRPQGGTWDIGAFEFPGAGPSTVNGLRIGS